MTTCQDIRELLYLLPDGELNASERDRLQGHLRACPACRGELAEVEAMVAALRSSEAPGAPAGFAGRVQDLILAPPARVIPLWRRAVPLASAAAILGLVSWMAFGPGEAPLEPREEVATVGEAAKESSAYKAPGEAAGVSDRDKDFGRFEKGSGPGALRKRGDLGSGRDAIGKKGEDEAGAALRQRAQTAAGGGGEEGTFGQAEGALVAEGQQQIELQQQIDPEQDQRQESLEEEESEALESLARLAEQKRAGYERERSRAESPATAGGRAGQRGAAQQLTEELREVPEALQVGRREAEDLVRAAKARSADAAPRYYRVRLPRSAPGPAAAPAGPGAPSRPVEAPERRAEAGADPGSGKSGAEARRAGQRSRGAGRGRSSLPSTGAPAEEPAESVLPVRVQRVVLRPGELSRVLALLERRGAVVEELPPEFGRRTKNEAASREVSAPADSEERSRAEFVRRLLDAAEARVPLGVDSQVVIFVIEDPLGSAAEAPAADRRAREPQEDGGGSRDG